MHCLRNRPLTGGLGEASPQSPRFRQPTPSGSDRQMSGRAQPFGSRDPSATMGARPLAAPRTPSFGSCRKRGGGGEELFKNLMHSSPPLESEPPPKARSVGTSAPERPNTRAEQRFTNAPGPRASPQAFPRSILQRNLQLPFPPARSYDPLFRAGPPFSPLPQRRPRDFPVFRRRRNFYVFRRSFARGTAPCFPRHVLEGPAPGSCLLAMVNDAPGLLGT